MDFDQKVRKRTNEENYHSDNLRITREFSKQLILEMKDLVKSVVLFGSNISDTLKKDSDIDLMIVLDNISVYVTPELREAYRIISSNLNENIAGGKIHLMTVNLTDYWDMCRKGDPVMINILRHGIAIFDRDLFDPMQYLLEIGRVRPSLEAVYNYSSRSQTLMEETDKHLQTAILDLYYSVVDMVHASLMVKGITPPSPKEMPEIFKKTFKGSAYAKYSADIKKFYDVAKDIEHGKMKTIDGKFYDMMKQKAKDLIFDLDTFIKEELKNKSSLEI